MGTCSNTWAEEHGPNDLYTNHHYPRLWKSTDGGVTWSDKTSKVLDAKNLPSMPDVWANTTAEDFAYFAGVSVAPDDPDFVVVVGWAWDNDAVSGDYYVPVVVGSNDGAGKFYYMGCSTASGMITCVDVAMEVDDKHSIAVGTWDWENESPAGPNVGNYDNDNATVWRYDAGGYWSAYWADTSTLDGWAPVDAIVDVEFSPNFDVDDTIVVLAIGDVNDTDLDIFGDSLADADAVNDYAGFMVQAGTWNRPARSCSKKPASASCSRVSPAASGACPSATATSSGATPAPDSSTAPSRRNDSARSAGIRSSAAPSTRDSDSRSPTPSDSRGTGSAASHST